MKFEVTSFNTFEVMPRIRFHDGQTDRVTPVYTPQLRFWEYNEYIWRKGFNRGENSIYHHKKHID